MQEQIDLKNIQCIPHHQMLAILNQYIISSVDHINKIADFAQKQFVEIDSLIDGLQCKVQILQKKIGIDKNNKIQEIQQQQYENNNNEYQEMQ